MLLSGKMKASANETRLRGRSILRRLSCICAYAKASDEARETASIFLLAKERKKKHKCAVPYVFSVGKILV